LATASSAFDLGVLGPIHLVHTASVNPDDNFIAAESDAKRETHGIIGEKAR
jgi:hypothetical protein